MGIGRWRPLAVVVLSAISIGGLAVSLAWPDPGTDPAGGGSTGVGAAGADGAGADSPPAAADLSGWSDERWPVRGDLADDDDARAAVTDAVHAAYPGSDTRLLWVGDRPGADGTERPRAYVVVADASADTGAPATVAELRRRSDGSWTPTAPADTSAATAPVTQPVTADGSAPAVVLPSADGAVPIALAATDATAASAVLLGADGVVVVPVPVEDGLTTLDPATFPAAPGCASPLLRYDAPAGSDYLPPWGGPGLLALSTRDGGQPPGPDLLASLVAGVCGSGTGVLTELSWPVLDLPALEAFPDPDGSAAVARLAFTQPDGSAAATLAYVPAGGTAPALIGRPPPRDPGAGPELAAVVSAGADAGGGSAVFAVGIANPPATVPELPVIASQPGIAVLGPLSTPDSAVAVVYAGADGQPTGTDLLR